MRRFSVISIFGTFLLFLLALFSFFTVVFTQQASAVQLVLNPTPDSGASLVRTQVGTIVTVTIPDIPKDVGEDGSAIYTIYLSKSNNEAKGNEIGSITIKVDPTLNQADWCSYSFSNTNKGSVPSDKEPWWIIERPSSPQIRYPACKDRGSLYYFTVQIDTAKLPEVNSSSEKKFWIVLTSSVTANKELAAYQLAVASSQVQACSKFQILQIKEHSDRNVVNELTKGKNIIIVISREIGAAKRYNYYFSGNAAKEQICSSGTECSLGADINSSIKVPDNASNPATISVVDQDDNSCSKDYIVKDSKEFSSSIETKTPLKTPKKAGDSCDPDDKVQKCEKDTSCQPTLNAQNTSTKYTCQVTLSAPQSPPPIPPCLEGEGVDRDGNFTTDIQRAVRITKCTKINTALGPFNTSPEQFVTKVFATLLGFAGGIALLFLIYAGYKLIVSRGNPEAMQGAKELLTSVIVGLLFIIFSFVTLEVIGVNILKIPGFGGTESRTDRQKREDELFRQRNIDQFVAPTADPDELFRSRNEN